MTVEIIMMNQINKMRRTFRNRFSPPGIKGKLLNGRHTYRHDFLSPQPHNLRLNRYHNGNQHKDFPKAVMRLRMVKVQPGAEQEFKRHQPKEQTNRQRIPLAEDFTVLNVRRVRLPRITPTNALAPTLSTTVAQAMASVGR